jgi:dTDP-4-dehydrorhamnose 3,5-epimerase
MLKGWFAHEKKLDRYHLVTGELLVILYDDREGSPTRGVVQKLVLSEKSARQVLIPPMIWHLSLNVGQQDAILVNLPSTHYDHENPDRFHMSIDSGDIPVDVRSFFPVTYSGSQNIAGTFC